MVNGPTEQEPSRQEADTAQATPSGSGQASGTTTSRGGKRRQESRRKLLVAARRLFVERGYHDTRPQDISKAADVGHGTFYLHFQDKQDCFLAFVEEAAKEFDKMVFERLDGVEDFDKRIEITLTTVLDYHLANPGVYVSTLSNPGIMSSDHDYRVGLYSNWAELWAHRLRLCKEKGSVYDDVDPKIIGWTLVALLYPLCTGNMVTHENRDYIVQNIKRLLVRGLMTKAADD